MSLNDNFLKILDLSLKEKILPISLSWAM